MSANHVLKKVARLGKGRFILNDSVLIYDFDATTEGVTYMVNFDENTDAETAEALASEFVNRTLRGAMEKENSQQE